MSGVSRETKQSNSKYPQPIFGHFPPPRRTRLDTNADKSRILSRSNLATRDFGLGNRQIFTELRNRKASDSMGQAEFGRCLAAVGISRIEVLTLKLAGAWLDCKVALIYPHLNSPPRAQLPKNRRITSLPCAPRYT